MSIQHRIALVLVIVSAQAIALDIGVVGPTHDIAEPDLLEVIQSRLRQMQVSGDLARKQDAYRDRVISTIEKPEPVSGLKATRIPRTYFVDPSRVLDRDVRAADGTLLYPKGLAVNPLDYVHLSRKLVFFDGRDRRQVAFAAQASGDKQSNAKPILTAGEPLKLMRSWKRPVFYDQGGAMVRRLGIVQMPAVVSQDGRRLRVDEIRP